MSNEKYEARVRRLAEETNQKVTPDLPLSSGDYMRAQIAVKYMAEMYVQGWKDSREGSFLVDPVSLHLHEYGLIPEPESKS